MQELRSTEDHALCITRRKRGRGYEYFDENGEKIRNAKLLERLKALVIPPMWEKVRICSWDNGHIQATGRDGKGRKQYIYHPDWEKQRQEAKFMKMKAFGEALPAAREAALSALQPKGWSRQKIMALMFMVLDETGIRIGNSYYADHNDTYGLSTLRRKHLSIEDNVLFFEYTGKSNKKRQVQIEDDALIEHIKRAAEMPGYEIFRYQKGRNQWESVDSEDVNAYIQQLMGDQFYSKDFRTWVASRLAVKYYPEAVRQQRENPRKKLVNTLVKLVAQELGNTEQVCRTYYIHPTVLQLVENQQLPEIPNSKSKSPAHSPAEKLLLSIL